MSVLDAVIVVLLFNSFFTAHLNSDARFDVDIVYEKSHNLVCQIN